MNADSIKIISHYDSDGITAAAILAKTLQKIDKKFNIKIVKQIEDKVFSELKKEGSNFDLIFFLDLGSNNIQEINALDKNVFVLDHHEIINRAEPSEKVTFINRHLYDGEEISAAGIVYLFSEALGQADSYLAKLALVGMIGDMADRTMSRVNNKILKDSQCIVKKGLQLFSSTRPIHKALEFSSGIYIPGVTGNASGVISILREAGIKIRDDKSYKTMQDLTNEEMVRLVTSIALIADNDKIIGNIYLLKLFNQLEDARELSTLINACGRLDEAHTALAFCLGFSKAKAAAENVYCRYKHFLIEALNWANVNKIEKEDYVLINAKENIKDSMIGTISSILASSFIYPEGTVIIGSAMRDDGKIKVSMRVCGESEIDLSKKVENACRIVGGEFGGHKRAAGALIEQDKEPEFMMLIEKEIESQKIKV